MSKSKFTLRVPIQHKKDGDSYHFIIEAIKIKNGQVTFIDFQGNEFPQEECFHVTKDDYALPEPPPQGDD